MGVDSGNRTCGVKGGRWVGELRVVVVVVVGE